jgi:hypothetical protein
LISVTPNIKNKLYQSRHNMQGFLGDVVEMCLSSGLKETTDYTDFTDFVTSIDSKD